MLKYQIDRKNKNLSYECAGDFAELATDAITCLKRTYDAMKAVNSEEATSLISFIIGQLANPNSAFYEDVDWDDEEWGKQNAEM